MSDCRLMSRDFLREFIEMYREHPCLWQRKSKEYLNRNKKHKAYKLLVEKLQTVEPNATRTTVINKINTLRGGFRREYKKVQSSKRSGAGATDVYTPSLWYYNLLLFVRDQDTPRDSDSNVPSDDNFEEDIEMNGEVYKRETSINPGDYLYSPSPPPPSSASCSKTVNKKKCIPVIENSDQILDAVSARLYNCDDEFSIVGKNIAMKLRKLPKGTRIYTEKLINDLLFQAELGRITEHTRITSDSIHPTTRTTM